MRIPLFLLACCAFVAPIQSAVAQKPSAYPAKGQSVELKSTDDAACQAWAKQDTGTDPAVVASASVQSSGPQGERLRGAVRGAAAGAVIGEVANGGASDGAAIGATAGVVAGGARGAAERSCPHATGAGRAVADGRQVLARLGRLHDGQGLHRPITP